MRTHLCLMVCCGLAALCLSQPALARVKDKPTNARLALTSEYLDGLFRARPHLASFMGDHRFDELVMDVGDAAVARRKHELEALDRKAALVAASSATSDVDALVDLSILRQGIALERLYLEEIADWEWDPRLYDSLPFYDPREVVADRLSTLVHGDFAPEAQRRKSAVAQLAALPRYLNQVRTSLIIPYGHTGRPVPTTRRRAPKVYVEQAIKVNQGRLDFFETELRPFIKGDKRGEAAFDAAVIALKAYQKFLSEELLPVANGDWRLGRATYDKKFPLALQTDRSPDDMVKRAEADFAKTRAELGAVARTLHQQLWPNQPLTDRSAAADAAIIGRVKEELSKRHAKPEELVQAHGRKLDALRAFIEKHALVDLPPRDSLSVEPMPGYKRGSSAAEYLAPGMLDARPGFHATYYVDPIDPTWDAARVESYLRGQNDYEVELVASHEAYPGHHTQAAQERKAPNALRATLWNGPMVEGWAVYGEGQMVSHGWGDKDNLRYRFYDLRGRMIAASNLILDVKLQRGQMTDEEAVRFMVEQGFQEKAMAEKKLLRAKLDSTQLCQYFLGLDEIEELRREAEKKGKLVEHDFHMGLIGHGPIAVRYLRSYLLK